MGAALLCLEPVELAEKSSVDPWELARAWGYEVLTLRGTAPWVRLDRAIWVDGDASRSEQGRQIAAEFAACALDAVGVEASDEAIHAVTEMLLEPQQRGDFHTIDDVLAEEEGRPREREREPGSHVIGR